MAYFGGGVWRCERCHGRAPSSWDHDGGPLMQMLGPESGGEARKEGEKHDRTTGAIPG